jgi:hypothetical protein
MFAPLMILLLMASPLIVQAEAKPENSKPQKKSEWFSEQGGFSIKLVPVNRDYSRAVFYARGMPAEVVEEMANYCVFGTIVKNLSAKPLSYDMSTWRAVTVDGVEHRMKLKSTWIQEWQAKGVGFRWLLLAEAQTFEEGDWIQGFSTVKLAPAAIFDLHYSWSRGEQVFYSKLEGVTCADHQPAK